MPSIWERFESMLDGMATPKRPSNTGWREYGIATDDGQFVVHAQQVQYDMLLLRCIVERCIRPPVELLVANGKSRFWKFALSAGSLVLQIEIFGNELARARDIVSSIGQPHKYATGEVHDIVTDTDREKGEDGLLAPRIRAVMQAEAPQFVSKEDGGWVIEMRHAGERSSHLLVCKPAPGQLIEMRSLISKTKPETEGAKLYLLRCNVGLTGCRTALNESGLPFVIAFVPYSAIEGGDLLKWLERMSQSLFDVRHVQALNHQVVNHLYQSMRIVKKGDADYGIDVSRN